MTDPMDGPMTGSVSRVLVRAGNIQDEQVRTFWVETYCQLLEDTSLKQWHRKKSASHKKTMIYMQDKASSHASKL